MTEQTESNYVSNFTVCNFVGSRRTRRVTRRASRALPSKFCSRDRDVSETKDAPYCRTGNQMTDILLRINRFFDFIDHQLLLRMNSNCVVAIKFRINILHIFTLPGHHRSGQDWVQKPGPGPSTGQLQTITLLINRQISEFHINRVCTVLQMKFR